MSQKRAREQRRLQRNTDATPPAQGEAKQLPLPSSSTNTYTLTLKDSMLGWYSWQLRPKPLMRRLLLVLAVALAWAFFLARSKAVNDPLSIYMFSLVVIPMYFMVAAAVSTFMGFMSWQIRKVQFKDVIMYWDEERVEWVNPVYSPRHTWRQFKGHHVTSRLVILALQGTMLIIPTRAFKTQTDLDNFTAIAARKAVGLNLNPFKKRDSGAGSE